MTTAEEQMQVLRMIESGQISAEEGVQLLAALSEEKAEPRKAESRARPLSKRQRLLRVRVTDLATGRHQVDINLPLNLVRIGAKMGARFTPEEIDFDAVIEALDAGAVGKILDVVDEEDSERVEIFVD